MPAESQIARPTTRKLLLSKLCNESDDGCADSPSIPIFFPKQP